MPCQFTIFNRTPPDWRVSIIEGGAVFNHRAGENGNAGPFGMNVPTGGSYAFSDPSPAGCVNEIFLSIKVRTPLEPGDKLISQVFNDPSLQPNQCIQQMSASLGPKSSAMDITPSTTEELIDSLEIVLTEENPT